MGGTGPVILAADGGATASRALVAALDGTVLWEGRGRAASATRGGPEGAGQVLAEHWIEGLRSLGTDASRVRGAACGLAGARSTEVQEKVGEAMTGALDRSGVRLEVPLQVTHDAAIALEGAFPGEGGCVVISGTGSVAAARRPGAAAAMAGGWGWPLGDEGSGTWLGWRAAQEAAGEMEEGAGGVYAGILQEGWGMDLEGREALPVLLRSASAASAAPSRWSGLAPLVIRAMRTWPEETRALREELGIRLGLLAAQAMERAGWREGQEVPVALTGGVGSRFRDLLEAPFRGGAGGYGEVLRWRTERLSHLGGAAVLALGGAGRPPGEGLLDRLGRGLSG
ncbi:MAG: BadF/BadG/BcrA/BcrD ATPase family protein [bacterium]